MFHGATDYGRDASCRMLAEVHPILIHLGAVSIPSYGALAAAGVLAALFLGQHTAHAAQVNAGQVWNLSVVALFAALVAERLLLIAVNFGEVSRHPGWVLRLAMVNHPLLAGTGALGGAAAAFGFAHWQRMPFAKTADALAAPVALGLAFEQVGALMAGAGYGTETSVPWAVTYTHPLAALWNGAPLGVPVHPVQGYAALAFAALAAFLLAAQRKALRPGDLAGLALMGAGVAVYMTELWRDNEGRGTLPGGALSNALDGPQIAAIAMVLGGAIVLCERKGTRTLSEAQHG